MGNNNWESGGLSYLNYEKSRSYNPVLLSAHSLGSVVKGPYQNYTDKKKKSKPFKQNKEEEEEEEGGEKEKGEYEPQDNGNESVAISPPPDGSSVAEAKPFGLAIAGPGGIAASKPQGTAVVGPGGLAIARPVGTAIAGVKVEGSVPIGAPSKNNKKPKQEPDQSDGELHYVGGLTGPIGNPQPNKFADTTRSVREENEKDKPENLYFRRSESNEGFQLTLGQYGDKYGFIPTDSSSPRQERLQKRTDSPKYYRGLVGTIGTQVYYPYQDYQYLQYQ